MYCNLVRRETQDMHHFFQYIEKLTKQPHNCSHIVGGRCFSPGLSRDSSLSGVGDAMVCVGRQGPSGLFY